MRKFIVEIREDIHGDVTVKPISKKIQKEIQELWCMEPRAWFQDGSTGKAEFYDNMKITKAEQRMIFCWGIRKKIYDEYFECIAYPRF